MFVVFEREVRKNIPLSPLYLAVSYFVAALLLSPFLYFFINGFSDAQKIINSPTIYSSDLLIYIIPIPVTRIGRSVFSSITSSKKLIFVNNYSA